MQVLHVAMRESDERAMWLAALLHDVGKQVDSHGHEKHALDILGGRGVVVSSKVEWLIVNHMRFWTYQLGEMKRQAKIASLVHHQWFPDLSMLCRWDKMGRTPGFYPEFTHAQFWTRYDQLG